MQDPRGKYQLPTRLGFEPPGRQHFACGHLFKRSLKMNALISSTLSSTLTMSSREIAELTGKKHMHVMRDIRNMLEALGKDVTSFGSIFQDTYGRDQNEYRLDRELTMTLVSGYDIPLRHRVVTKLAELEAKQGKADLPMDPVLRSLVISLQELDSVKQQQANHEARLVEIEAHLPTPQTHMTILGFASALGVDLSLGEASKLGKAASNACMIQGDLIQHVPDTRYGVVNSYPLRVLTRLFDERTKRLKQA